MAAVVLQRGCLPCGRLAGEASAIFPLRLRLLLAAVRSLLCDGARLSRAALPLKPGTSAVILLLDSVAEERLRTSSETPLRIWLLPMRLLLLRLLRLLLLRPKLSA